MRGIALAILCGGMFIADCIRGKPPIDAGSGTVLIITFCVIVLGW